MNAGIVLAIVIIVVLVLIRIITWIIKQQTFQQGLTTEEQMEMRYPHLSPLTGYGAPGPTQPGQGTFCPGCGTALWGETVCRVCGRQLPK
jgi:hypothetical protein